VWAPIDVGKCYRPSETDLPPEEVCERFPAVPCGEEAIRVELDLMGKPVLSNSMTLDRRTDFTLIECPQTSRRMTIRADVLHVNNSRLTTGESPTSPAWKQLYGVVETE
jgi:hypothetical protein